jgi:hypothetical protein
MAQRRRLAARRCRNDDPDWVQGCKAQAARCFRPGAHRLMGR